MEEFHFSMSIDLILGVTSFSGIILLLVLVIILARSKLVSTGNVSIEINGDASNPIVVPAGSKLLQTLADNNIFLASACGGGGTCSQCKCQVLDGGGSILKIAMYEPLEVLSNKDVIKRVEDLFVVCWKFF